jgi:hypothetical protein
MQTQHSYDLNHLPPSNRELRNDLNTIQSIRCFSPVCARVTVGVPMYQPHPRWLMPVVDTYAVTADSRR